MNIRSLMMCQPGRDELYSIMMEKLQKLLLQREGSNTHRNSKFRSNDEVQYLRYNREWLEGISRWRFTGAKTSNGGFIVELLRDLKLAKTRETRRILSWDVISENRFSGACDEIQNM